MPKNRGDLGSALRVGLYARVSTTGKGQDVEAQLRVLRETAAARGWVIMAEDSDTISGSKGKRAGRDHVLGMARRREIDMIAVWRLDRWGRSLADLSHSLQELRELGVAFYSHTESLDFSTAAGRAMGAMLGVFAEFERDLLCERVHMGLDNARAKGKKLGRPKMDEERVSKVLQLLSEGQSWRSIGKRLKVGQESIARIQRGWKAQHAGRIEEATKELAAETARRILADWHKYRDAGKEAGQ